MERKKMPNHTTVRWITIIVMIFIASVSICFGVIKSTNAQDTERFLTRLDNQYIMIMEMKTQSAVIETELKNLNKQVEELNAILRYEYSVNSMRLKK